MRMRRRSPWLLEECVGVRREGGYVANKKKREKRDGSVVACCLAEQFCSWVGSHIELGFFLFFVDVLSTHNPGT